MKKLVVSLLFFLLLGTTSVSARLSVLSPEAMIERAQFIVVGEVREIRDNEEPDFVLDVVRVYKGEVVTARLVIPQPRRPGLPGTEELLRPPAVGSQILLFVGVSEAGRLIPTADLNWMGILEGERVSALYMGAAVNEWDEARYIEVYNEFLENTPGKTITSPQEREEVPDEDAKPYGFINPAIFFFMAGVAFIMLVISAKLKKTEY